MRGNQIFASLYALICPSPKVFSACCGFILDRLKKAGAKRRAKAKWQQSFEQFVASMSWQVLQVSTEVLEGEIRLKTYSLSGNEQLGSEEDQVR